jgi:hypothetical protein
MYGSDPGVLSDLPIAGKTLFKTVQVRRMTDLMQFFLNGDQIFNDYILKYSR